MTFPSTWATPCCVKLIPPKLIKKYPYFLLSILNDHKSLSLLPDPEPPNTIISFLYYISLIYNNTRTELCESLAGGVCPTGSIFDHANVVKSKEYKLAKLL